MRRWLTFTNIVTAIFFIYFLVVFKSFYEIFNPDGCARKNTNDCIYSVKNWKKHYGISICIPQSQKSLRLNSQFKCSQSFDLSDLSLDETSKKELRVELPTSTRKNGTLLAYVFLAPKSELKNLNSISSSSKVFNKELLLTKYQPNNSEVYVNLLEANTRESTSKTKPITHLLVNVNIYALDTTINFDRYQIPGEMMNDLRLIDNNEYLPIIHIDKLSIKNHDYKPLNPDQAEFVLNVNYMPISIGKYRLLKQLEASIELFKEYGISDDQLKEVIAIFTDTDFYILMLTLFVTVFHTLFEFLAFKNDINFWRKRKTTEGLSLKTLLWRGVSQIIIFLYLMEENTSLIILIPSGISVLIETWKMFKAFKIKISFKWSIIPSFTFGETSSKEKETNQYDSIAMKKLSYVLYPLCIGGAVYSLVYNTHKNWFSWLINSMVNGVYAFGFLFMTPQLFLNYKLKSVAHLPWRAFMYKSFNTFIDDVFAFIIKMPTSHRLACLRDDLVFLIYLYQRWLYPIDRSRVNEFGESFENIEKNEIDKKTD